MSRRDVDHARSAQSCMLHAHALSIDRQGRDLRARGLKARHRAHEARVLDGHLVAGIDEYARRQVERLLHAGDDGHLVGGAIHSPRCVQIIGERLAQRPISHRFATQKVVGGKFPQAAGRELCPQIHRKQIHRGDVGAEGAEAALLISG